MTLDILIRPEHRPDKQLLKRLASRQRTPVAIAIPRLERQALGRVASARVAHHTHAPPADRSEQQNKPEAFLKKVRTMPGIGMPSSPGVRESKSANPWHDHKLDPPLPAFAIQALRSAVRASRPLKKEGPPQAMTRLPPGLLRAACLPAEPPLVVPRAQTFSAAELEFFDEGDALAALVPFDDDEAEEEEAERRWWQRRPMPGSTNQ